ncbi:MAG TPA: hypothetical protein PKC91_09660 [Ignavibacteria bacterium]|nr:hypothetical protein [Ignavibacteria bacterium]
MQIKKFLLAFFIIFSLSFSFQPVTSYAKEREVIVYIMNKDLDSNTSDFINKNEHRKFVIQLSLILNVMMINKSKVTFNTS